MQLLKLHHALFQYRTVAVHQLAERTQDEHDRLDEQSTSSIPIFPRGIPMHCRLFSAVRTCSISQFNASLPTKNRMSWSTSYAWILSIPPGVGISERHVPRLFASDFPNRKRRLHCNRSSVRPARRMILLADFTSMMGLESLIHSFESTNELMQLAESRR
jgi:hypothetical protein